MQTQTTTIAQLTSAQIHCILFLLTSTSILYKSPIGLLPTKLSQSFCLPRILGCAGNVRLFLFIDIYRYGKHVVSVLVRVRNVGRHLFYHKDTQAAGITILG